MQKYIVLIFSFILCINVFLRFPRSDLIRITFCDVGQGDAVLISHGAVQLLVDSGKNDSVLSCLEDSMPFWDKTIEFFVLTHMDSDHIGGAPQVLAQYSVNFIFINPSDKKSSDFEALEQAVSRKLSNNFRVIHTFPAQLLQLSEMVGMRVVSPQVVFPQVGGEKTTFTETMLSDVNSKNQQKKFEKLSENDRSIGLFITIGSVSILLPGDLELDGELALEQAGMLQGINILKAGHHGAKTSSNRHFISTLQPEVSVISSGKNNQYNHPHPRVLQTLREFGAYIYQTSRSGNITFLTDGLEYWEAI